VIAVAFSVFSIAMDDRFDRPLNNNVQGAFAPPTSRSKPSCHNQKHVPAITPLQWVTQTEPRPLAYCGLHLACGQGAHTWAGVTYPENFEQYVIIASAARLKYLGGTPNRRQRKIEVNNKSNLALSSIFVTDVMALKIMHQLSLLTVLQAVFPIVLSAVLQVDTIALRNELCRVVLLALIGESPQRVVRIAISLPSLSPSSFHRQIFDYVRQRMINTLSTPKKQTTSI
jgi:hypothetical protein